MAKRKVGALKALKPININEQTWMYAERKALFVVRQTKIHDGTTVTEMFSIPWGKVRRALAIKDGETPNG